MSATSPLTEVRRFLHCNYNCVDVDGLERWYTEMFALKPVMRTGEAPSDGWPFGLQMPTASSTVFLYDQRGGRVATSLELVRWTSPPTCGAAYADPWMLGLQSVAYRVPDVDEVVRRAAQLGGEVVRRQGQAALLRDPEGVNVEVVATPGEQPEAHHLRLVVSDLGRSREWYESIGFSVLPDRDLTPTTELWQRDADHAMTAEVALAGTTERTFALLLTTWSGPPRIQPTYGAPFHQGLYRMAVAVDDIHATYDALAAAGIAQQAPYTFALPGTPITEGLTILFVRDPDGVLVELVERSPSIFRS